MENKVESILKQLEARFRGEKKSIAADHDMLNLSYEIFEKCHTDSESETPMKSFVSPLLLNLDADGRKHWLSIAIKIHNKIRNLSSIHYVEVKNVLKAAAAIMISVYGEETPKSICIAIKLLSKAAHDIAVHLKKTASARDFISTEQLVQLSEKADSLVVQCSSTAIRLWSTSNSVAAQKLLPPVEYQDMKMAAYQAYLDQALALSRQSTSANQDSIRKALSGAMVRN